MAVAAHWLLSAPFLFLGPMLTTPSHGGIIGWVYFVLEFPAIVTVALTVGIGRPNVFGSSIAAEYADFVLWGAVFWFAFAAVVTLVVRLITEMFQWKRAA